MHRVDVFDPPMCCSTGVCGPVVDPSLPRFAGDLAWLERNGIQIARYNLAQEPMAFATNEIILEILEGRGPDALPVVLVDGAMKSQGRYPSREELATWAEVALEEALEAPSAPKLSPKALPSLSLPTAACCDPDDEKGCCG
jgi:hypothetical protein